MNFVGLMSPYAMTPSAPLGVVPLWVLCLDIPGLKCFVDNESKFLHDRLAPDRFLLS